MTGSAHAAVTAHLTAADPALPIAAVSAVVYAVAANGAAAARLLEALDRDPSLPLLGTASMPPALQRIIARLRGDFDTTLQLPRCEDCDREMAALLRRVQRRRLCVTCSRRMVKKMHQCFRCAKTVLHVRSGGDHEYCPPCWGELLLTRVGALAMATRRFASGSHCEPWKPPSPRPPARRLSS